jgi:hypothetical protein
MKSSRLFAAACLFLLLSFVVSSASAYQCDERMALWDHWTIDASGPGPSFTQTWGLVNNTGCPISGFTLGNPQVFQYTGSSYIPYSGAVSGSYSTFSLEPDGGTGQVTANFSVTVPPGTVLRIFF